MCALQNSRVPGTCSAQCKQQQAACLPGQPAILVNAKHSKHYKCALQNGREAAQALLRQCRHLGAGRRLVELMNEPVTGMKLSPCGLELEEVQTATQRYVEAVQSLQGG